MASVQKQICYLAMYLMLYLEHVYLVFCNYKCVFRHRSTYNHFECHSHSDYKCHNVEKHIRSCKKRDKCASGRASSTLLEITFVFCTFDTYTFDTYTFDTYTFIHKSTNHHILGNGCFFVGKYFIV